MQNQYRLQCACMKNDAMALVTILDLSLLHCRLSIPDFHFFNVILLALNWYLSSSKMLLSQNSRTFKALKKYTKYSKVFNMRTNPVYS